MVNVDFTFDFKTKIARSYLEHDQDIIDLAKGHELGMYSTEQLIRGLIAINKDVLNNVLTEYNYELLNEI